MSTKISSLSVFFPAYNEEENIEKTIKDALAVLEKLDLDKFEIIVVEDGSKDKTAEIVANLEKEDKRIRLVKHEKNRGYGEALKTGFKASKYEWVAFADSDGQFDFSEITKFLDYTDEADYILGYRLKRADAYVRSLGTFVWTMMAKILLGLPAQDYSCGFKLIKKSAFEAILPLTSGEKVTQIEMLVKAKRAGFRFTEVGVHHYPRKFGSQTGANLRVVLKSYLDLIKLWWLLSNKLELAILLGILGLAAFLRMYKITEYMTFLGDEGRDALVIKRILTTWDLPLLGPVTSIGNMYLGPLYYYMMSVPMAIFWLKPEAAAVMVALIGVATVGLIYYLGKAWFGFYSAVVASFLYAISPVTIFYSRSSWNPNPTPFFALLAILGMYKLHESKNNKWLLLTGVSIAVACQMHYLASILLPVVGILWAVEFFKTDVKGNFIKWTLIGVAAFLFLMSPLVIFDLKHNYMNYRAISTFFGNREITVNLNPLNTVERIIPIYRDNLIGRYMAGGDKTATQLTAFILIAVFVNVLWMKWKKIEVPWAYFVLGVWLLVGILGLALYKQTIYDHYLGFLNPVPYFLLGSLMDRKWGKYWYIFVGILVIGLVFLNLSQNPLKNSPNNQLHRTQEISKYVIKESGNKPFNFALLSKNNYDAAYQFYLDIYGHKPKQVPFDITDQLFVVCEDPICEPIGHAKQEISHFGWAKIEKESEVLGVKVFKLVANPSGEPPK